MVIKSQAIVIHSLRYGEADLIVKLFTKTDGLRSYLIKGILKTKKGKLRPSFFLPLTLLHIEAVHKDKGTLERIKEAKIASTYQSLHTDLVKNSVVFFLAEVLKNSIREEEKNRALFEYLETSLLWLDTHKSVGNFHIVFLIKLSQYLGFYPDTSEIHKDYFNLQDGCFQNLDTNLYCIAGEHILKLKEFLGTTFEESINVKLSKTLRSQVLEVLLVYFELHLHEFKKPKSLAVLNEIFS